MCRWIAYRGSTIPLENYVVAPHHSLVSQSIRALESTASTNGDGFGLGWYGEHTEPGLYRDVRPAWADENLRYLCRHIKSHLFFAHVRAATGTPVVRPNCHPFACGRWLFMHNGYVGGWPRLRRRVEGLIRDEVYPSRFGTTDSEALFLAAVSAGLDKDPIGAVGEILSSVATMMAEAGDLERLLFTAALSDGETLYAFRYAYNDAPNTLYYHATTSGTVIVSEPLDQDRKKWEAVPENHVLVAAPGEPPRLAPFLEQRRRAAE